jgi:hypothetical protein
VRCFSLDIAADCLVCLIPPQSVECRKPLPGVHNSTGVLAIALCSRVAAFMILCVRVLVVVMWVMAVMVLPSLFRPYPTHFIHVGGFAVSYITLVLASLYVAGTIDYWVFSMVNLLAGDVARTRGLPWPLGLPLGLIPGSTPPTPFWDNWGSNLSSSSSSWW